MRARRRVARRVLEQIGEHLLDQARVDSHERQVVRQVDHHHVRGEAIAQAAQHRAGDLVQRAPVALELHRAGLEPRHLQHLGDELGHLARLLEDALRETRALLRRQPLAALGERGGRPGDHRERRAQIVRDRGKQRAAHALGLGLDRELGLRAGARTRSVSPETMRPTASIMASVSRYCGSSTWKVPRGGMKEVERRHAQYRDGDHRTAAVAQCDEHDSDQVHQRHVHDVEVRIEASPTSVAAMVAPAAQA